MIVDIKRAIAKTIVDGLSKQVRVRLSDFGGDRQSNKPTPEIEVSIFYNSSSYEPIVQYHVSPGMVEQSPQRSLSFSIIVRCKNLRTEDEVQDLVDTILFIISETVIYSQRLILSSDSAQGQEEGIWTYEINVMLPVPLDARKCQINWDELEVSEINVYLHVRDTPESTTVKVAEIVKTPDTQQ